MSKIIIGTSGYYYKDWIGTVYPAGTKEQDFFKIYCSEFQMAELNFSYYKQPVAGTMQAMAEKAGPGFLFCVKAHRSFTHELGADLEQNAAVYKEGIAPLKDSGKLGAVLFQFPYSFHYRDENRKYLDLLFRFFSGIPLVVEFRNDEWQRESVLHGLKQRNIGFVNVDEPSLEGLPGASGDVTAEIAYIRFHGRNKDNWWSGDNTTRYDYLYSNEELSEWIPRISEMIKTARILFIAFNNHFRGKAVVNARNMKILLETVHLL